MNANPKLIALRTVANALSMEPWDWITKITNDAEREFTRRASPRRVLALLDVAEAAERAARKGRLNCDEWDELCAALDKLRML